MTTEQDLRGEFANVKRVIANDMKFKARLRIREDAFTSITVGKTVGSMIDLGGAAATGASIAQSGTVATAFFAKSGLMAALGIGSTAMTPIGWVVAAALASGGAWYGVTRLFKGYEDSRVDVVPKFLSTPIDLLGASVLDLIGSLALKVAAMDGQIDPNEVTAIRDYFVHDWGYDADYVEHALSVLQANADKSRLSEMTKALAEFVHANPDCKFSAIQQEIKVLLAEVAEADGSMDEREEMAIERILQALQQENSLYASAGRAASRAAGTAASAAGWIGSRLGLGKD